MGTVPAKSIELILLPERMALCRLDAGDAVPAWAWTGGQFLSIGRSPTELSVIVDERCVPADVTARRDYRALAVRGPLPFDAVGVAAALTRPLADVGIPILLIGTYDTDYLLVREDQLTRAIAALASAGHRVGEPEGAAPSA